MTHFFSKSLSQALQEAGCTSNAGFFYVPGFNQIQWRHGVVTGEPLNPEWITAFHPWGLCGGSERARENAKKWWGIEETKVRRVELDGGYAISRITSVYTANVPAYDFHRHALIDLPEDEIEKYVWETMRKAA